VALVAPYHFPVSHSFPVTAIFYSSPIYILFNARLANADIDDTLCIAPLVRGRFPWEGCGVTYGSPGRGCGGTIGSPVYMRVKHSLLQRNALK
jgi:hypothetical protein